MIRSIRNWLKKLLSGKQVNFPMGKLKRIGIMDEYGVVHWFYPEKKT